MSKLEKIELSVHEWNMATRGNVYRNRKKYNRKKDKKNIKRQNPEFD